MNRVLFLPLLLLPAAAMADLPNKPTLTRYAQLWADSPFTSKPVIEREERVIENPLEDYALGGISKHGDDYYAVLINRKEPDKREIIRPGRDSDFEIVSVQWGEGSWKKTVATVKTGNHTGTVAFEEELLGVRKPPPQQQQQNQQQQKPGQPVIPGLNQNNPQANPGGARPPRPRVVRPPTPPGNTGNNNNTRSRGRGR